MDERPEAGDASQRPATPAAPTASQAMRLTPDGRIAAEEAFCLRCGYSVHGLPGDGACPECGMPVADSLRGRLLRYSDREYVRTLHRGAMLLLVGMILSVLLSVVGGGAGIGFAIANARATPAAPPVTADAPAPAPADAATPAPGPAPAAPPPGRLSVTMNTMVALFALLGVAVEMSILLGWWWFSSPDPVLPESERGDGPRRVIRSVVVLVAISAIANLGVAGAGLGGFRPTAGLLGIAGLSLVAELSQIARFFAAMLYLKWMAPRLPDEEVANRARLYIWLLPLIAVVGLCVLVGPLVAAVMQWLLLYRVRNDLMGVLAKMEDSDPGADAVEVVR